MGIQTMTAGRILQSGEAGQTKMDSLPNSALIKTYNVDYQTPDSAGTANAYLSGVKSRWGTLGVNAGTVNSDCSTLKGNEVEAVIEKAKKAGKSIGIVTTTYVTHASPAAAYAKSPYRGWYSDREMINSLGADGYAAVKDSCKDIATQFHEKRYEFDVALAGGRRYFYPDNVEIAGNKGYRKDGANYVNEWIEDKNLTYISTREELLNYKRDDKPLIGLFAHA